MTTKSSTVVQFYSGCMYPDANFIGGPFWGDPCYTVISLFQQRQAIQAPQDPGPAGAFWENT